MRTLLVCLHLGTGIAYAGVMAGLVGVDLIKQRHNLPRYGLALFCMAGTIGLHHLEMASHLNRGALDTRSPLDVLTVSVAFVFATVWAVLRIEATAGGRGDRRLFSIDWWRIIVGLSGFYVGVVGTVSFYEVSHVNLRGDHAEYLAIQLPLIVMYVLVSWWLLITQVSRYLALGQGLGYWSVSGMTLGLMFFSEAMSHVAYIVYRLNGHYNPSPHLVVVDFVGAGAALWFCREVRRLRPTGDRWAP